MDAGDSDLRCAACGVGLRTQARFCDACGSPVGSSGIAGERKQITVLFADVVGSMKLAAALDSERWHEIMRYVFNRSAAVVQRYQGTVDKFTGDGLMAVVRRARGARETTRCEQVSPHWKSKRSHVRWPLKYECETTWTCSFGSV